MDETALKTNVRANPGIVLIKERRDCKEMALSRFASSCRTRHELF